VIEALGEPKETAVCDPVGSDGSMRYWRAQHLIHPVPKRSLEEIIVNVYT